MTDQPVYAIGLMSGTSLDGIDAALIRSDGVGIQETGPDFGRAYEPAFRDRLRGLLGSDPLAAGEGGETATIVRDLTLLHAEAVERLIALSGLQRDQIGVIGFHGHTVLHRPQDGITRQIGDGGLLAAETGIPVVNDFRAADVAAGGEGAPFAPLYHAALAADLEKPVAVLNLGGVGNVTWIGEGGDENHHLLAFDTGPGNALIDDWTAAAIGRPMDEGGRLARGGTVDEAVLAALLDNPYFHRPPPKSLDRIDFDSGPVAGLSAADGAATLSRFTAEAVKRGIGFFPAPARRWLVTGGGRHNGTLMQILAEVLKVPVDPVEAVGWQGDALEAQAFAYLAVRSLRGLPLSLPATTGVSEPQSGGVLHRP